MKRVLLLLLFTATLLSCEEKALNQSTSLAIEFVVPKLLDRPEKTQVGNEWDLVQNRYASALGTLRKSPDAVSPCIDLAELFINEARITGEHGHYYPAALKVLDKGLKGVSEGSDEEFRALSLKASVLLSQHEFQEALDVGKRALALNTYNAAIYGILVDAYVELGQYDKAVLMADKMIAIRPDLRSYSRVSYLREIYGDPEGAIQAMHLAVDAGAPGFEQLAWTRLTLGELYQRYGKIDQAEKQFLIALQERENYPFAIAALAGLAIDNNELDQAEKLLKQACEIIPEVGFYEQLMTVYQLKGNKTLATSIKQQILEMLEDDVIHGHNMNMEYAEFYFNENEIDKALKYAKKEYDKRPKNIDVNKMLAKIYLANNQIDLATQHRKKALVTGSKDPELLAVTKQISQAL